MAAVRYCSLCREPLPALPDDAAYVDELNHTMHDRCREQRDSFVTRREVLLSDIAAGTSKPIPPEVRSAYLASIEARGLTRRCPCLYDEAHGFRGYGTDKWSPDDDRDYDDRNAVSDCRLCGGTGSHDQLPELLAIPDDAVATRWIQDKILRGSGPLRDHHGWHYSTLERRGHDRVPAGVVLYNADLTLGGIVPWAELVEVFRPRAQQTFF